MHVDQAEAVVTLTDEDEILINAYCELVAKVAKRLYRQAEAALTPDPQLVYSVPVPSILP